MRKWIDLMNEGQEITEGDVVSLSQHKSEKVAGEYSSAIQQIYKGEADFFAGGKFLPYAKAYIESGYNPEYRPVFYLMVTFRDFRPNDAAKQVLAQLRAKRFKIERTKYAKGYSAPKEGPWTHKEISFEDARELFLNRAHSPFGAYQPSRSGFRTSRIENYSEDGVGFCLSVLGMDYRRPGKYASETHRQEDHIIDDDKDWQEVASMMAEIKRAQSMKSVK